MDQYIQARYSDKPKHYNLRPTITCKNTYFTYITHLITLTLHIPIMANMLDKNKNYSHNLRLLISDHCMMLQNFQQCHHHRKVKSHALVAHNSYHCSLFGPDQRCRQTMLHICHPSQTDSETNKFYIFRYISSFNSTQATFQLIFNFA